MADIMNEKVDKVLRDILNTEDYSMILKMLNAMDGSPRNAKDEIRKILEDVAND